MYHFGLFCCDELKECIHGSTPHVLRPWVDVLHPPLNCHVAVHVYIITITIDSFIAPGDCSQHMLMWMILALSELVTEDGHELNLTIRIIDWEEKCTACHCQCEAWKCVPVWLIAGATLKQLTQCGGEKCADSNTVPNQCSSSALHVLSLHDEGGGINALLTKIMSMP